MPSAVTTPLVVRVGSTGKEGKTRLLLHAFGGVVPTAMPMTMTMLMLMLMLMSKTKRYKLWNDVRSYVRDVAVDADGRLSGDWPPSACGEGGARGGGVVCGANTARGKGER